MFERYGARRGWRDGLRLAIFVGAPVVVAVACGGSAERKNGDTASTATNGSATTSGGTTASTSTSNTATTESAGGASSTSSTTSARCETLGLCIECFTGLGAEAICLDEPTDCPEGLTLRDDCPEQSCGATLDHCCNTTTGLLEENVCGDDGYRTPCAEGSEPTYEEWCIPDGLPVDDCWSLEGLQCAGPAEHCRNRNPADTWCDCRETDEEDGRVWHCVVSAGP